MKSLKHSFLFFYICLVFFSSVINICAQQSIDSSFYYYGLANSPQTSHDLPLAFKFYLKHKELNQTRNDTLAVIRDLQQIAIIQFNMGFHSDSEISAVEGVKLLDVLEVNDITNQSRIGLYNQLGRIYRVFHDYEIALDYYNKAIKIAKSQKKLNTLHNNVAFVYKEQNKLGLAKKKFYEIYEKSLKVDDRIQIARSMDNLGFVKSKLDDPEALQLMTKALNLRLKINDLQGAYASYKHLTEYYRDNNDNQKAMSYADTALTIAKRINGVSYIEDALSNIVKLDKNPNVIEYKKLNDSINEAKKIRDNKYALFKYNFFEQEKIAKENELQKEKQKRLKLWYQTIGTFILLVSIFTYFILKARHKKEKLQQVYDTETRISKKVHDEVANDVYQTMTKLQSGTALQDEVLDDLEQIYTKTRDISKENSTIDFNGSFDESLKDLLLSYRNEEVNVITRNLSKVNWGVTSDAKKTTIYRVLQELMTNMKKHSKASNVVFLFRQKKNKIAIEYKDDGIGCNLKKSGGLQNTENRIKSVNGTITFETQINKGFKSNIIV